MMTETQKNIFAINLGNGYSKKSSIVKGDKYRITILSDVLVRFEYSEEGKFNDYPTIFALNRNFELSSFKVQEDNKYIIININVITSIYIIKVDLLRKI